MNKFLHVGCGNKRKSQTTQGFNTTEWFEYRLDIDIAVEPDLVGTMTDMASVESNSMDAIYSSHNIEHLYPHEVPVALGEFLRVLKQQGYAVITCPDLQSVCALVAENKLTESAYESPAGNIAPIDILYGLRSALAKGNSYMAHRCGFTQSVLQGSLLAAGFKSVATIQRGRPYFDLWAVATKQTVQRQDMERLTRLHFPSR